MTESAVESVCSACRGKGFILDHDPRCPGGGHECERYCPIQKPCRDCQEAIVSLFLSKEEASAVNRALRSEMAVWRDAVTPTGTLLSNVLDRLLDAMSDNGWSAR